jgi:Guanine nucleotide exchange factor synembryn
VFLVSRILFLCTASQLSAKDFIIRLVQGKGTDGNILETIGVKIDALVVQILERTKMAPEAMTDLLKFAFNIICHYPKVRRSTH